MKNRTPCGLPSSIPYRICNEVCRFFDVCEKKLNRRKHPRLSSIKDSLKDESLEELYSESEDILDLEQDSEDDYYALGDQEVSSEHY